MLRDSFLSQDGAKLASLRRSGCTPYLLVMHTAGGHCSSNWQLADQDYSNDFSGQRWDARSRCIALLFGGAWHGVGAEAGVIFLDVCSGPSALVTLPLVLWA